MYILCSSYIVIYKTAWGEITRPCSFANCFLKLHFDSAINLHTISCKLKLEVDAMRLKSTFRSESRNVPNFRFANPYSFLRQCALEPGDQQFFCSSISCVMAERAQGPSYPVLNAKDPSPRIKSQVRAQIKNGLSTNRQKHPQRMTDQYFTL